MGNESFRLAGVQHRKILNTQLRCYLGSLRLIDGLTEQYVLTRKAKDELLSEYQPSHSKRDKRRTSERFLRSHKGIKEKSLFFNATEQEQIDRLASLLSQDDARQLASHFDFSGGQIENIARKRTVDYILSGKYATLPEIEGYCRAELLSGKEHRAISFQM